LFWPLDYRVAFHSVFVIDPGYTLPFMFLLITAMFYNRKSKIRFRLNTIGLALSTSFLLFTLYNKSLMNSAFEKEAIRQNIIIEELQVRPAPLQNILWTGNIATENGYYIGYRSFMDKTNEISFSYFIKNHNLLKPYLASEELQRLLFITKGWYTVNKIDDQHFLINDLRFGLVDGIAKSTKRFVFAYKMTVGPEGNLTFDQEQYKFGKDVGDAALRALWNRMKGIE